MNFNGVNFFPRAFENSLMEWHINAYLGYANRCMHSLHFRFVYNRDTIYVRCAVHCIL